MTQRTKPPHVSPMEEEKVRAEIADMATRIVDAPRFQVDDPVFMPPLVEEIMQEVAEPDDRTAVLVALRLMVQRAVMTACQLQPIPAEIYDRPVQPDMLDGRYDMPVFRTGERGRPKYVRHKSVRCPHTMYPGPLLLPQDMKRKMRDGRNMMSQGARKTNVWFTYAIELKLVPPDFDIEDDNDE